MDSSLDALVSFLLQFLEAQGLTLTDKTLLIAARALPIAGLAPWLALPGTPSWVRGIVAATLVMTLGVHAPEGDAVALSSLARTTAVIGELMLGSLLALASSIPFVALGFAGRLTHRWAYAGVGTEHLPTLGSFHLLLGVMVFWQLGGVGLMVDWLLKGLLEAPLGTSMELTEDFAMGAIRMTAYAFGLGVAFSTPTAMALLIHDLTLAIFQRSAGLEGSLPLLRALCGLWGCFLALSLFLGEAPGMIEEAFDYALDEVVRLIS